MSEENIRVINLKKKQKIQSGISDTFFGFGFGAVSCPSSNKLASSYFRVGEVKVQHIRVYLRVVY